jgi:hypothetical protein
MQRGNLAHLGYLVIKRSLDAKAACQHPLVARIAATQIHRQVVVSVAIGLGIAFSHNSASYATKGTNVAVLPE